MPFLRLCVDTHGKWRRDGQIGLQSRRPEFERLRSYARSRLASCFEVCVLARRPWASKENAVTADHPRGTASNERRLGELGERIIGRVALPQFREALRESCTPHAELRRVVLPQV